MNELMAALLDIIKQQPRAQGLRLDQLEQIAEKAIKEDRVKDELWLQSQFEEAHKNLEAEAKASTVSEMLSHIHLSQPAVIHTQEDLDFVLKRHLQRIQLVLDPKVSSAYGRANLRHANLSGWDLSGKNLSCADLSYANLEGANLSFANLSGSQLKGANLKSANLIATNLKRANMDEALLEGALFDQVDAATSMV